MSEEDDQVIREYPAWREAVRQFLDAGFPVGHTVPEQWFHDVLQIEPATPMMPHLEGKRLELAFLNQFKLVEETLLLDHNIHLRWDKDTGGRRILPAPEQTPAAFSDGVRDINKGLRKMVKRLGSVDQEQLTDQQRTQNRNALAQAAFLHSSLKSVRRSPMLGGGKPKELPGSAAG